MNSMFAGASSFNGNISSWNVSAVTNMDGMFAGASSFNGNISSWNVSAVTNMDGMFGFATSFDQNLGNWYVTLDPDTIAGTGIPGVVGTISAQNQPLRDHVPTYDIVDGLDKNHFEIVSENRLNMTSDDSGTIEYSINVTAFGTTNVFESGNNWRVLVVRVSGYNNADLDGLAISPGTLSPVFSSSVITYAASQFWHAEPGVLQLCHHVRGQRGQLCHRGDTHPHCQPRLGHDNGQRHHRDQRRRLHCRQPECGRQHHHGNSYCLGLCDDQDLYCYPHACCPTYLQQRRP